MWNHPPNARMSVPVQSTRFFEFDRRHELPENFAFELLKLEVKLERNDFTMDSLT